MERTASPAQQLLDVRLGDDGPVTRFITDRRQRNMSWRAIADELADRTSTPVSYQSLRNWTTS